MIVRDLRVSESVAAVLGAKRVALLRRGPMPDRVRCAACKVEEDLNMGVAMSVVAGSAPDGDPIMFAHVRCGPSWVLPGPPGPVAARLRDPSAITGHALTVEGAPPVLAVETRTALQADTAGGEPVDLLLATLLARGLALVPRLDGPTLAGLPVLAGWWARPTRAGQSLQIRANDGTIVYDRVPVTVQAGWVGALVAGRRLTLLVASMTDPTTAPPHLAGPFARAGGDGRLVGGVVAVARPGPPARP
jgi:hypothetical protein